MQLLARRFSYYILLLAVIALTFPISSIADENQTLGELKDASYTKNISNDALGSLARLTVSPIELKGGGSFTLISPLLWRSLASSVTESIKQIHSQLTTLVGDLPPFSTSVRLIDQDTFSKNTGAPKWTNALYFRGQIMIPLSASESPDVDNLDRAVRHEYTHAVINTLSGGRCPGWLDEGLAQWIEGTENPALRPALYRWLKSNQPIGLNLLQGGFTRLDNEMVPAAYAQSLFTATVVINTFGFERIRTYLDELKLGQDKIIAFERGFGIPINSFEERLGRTLTKWQGHQEPDKFD